VGDDDELFRLCELATSPALASIPPLSLVVRSRERGRGVGTCAGKRSKKRAALGTRFEVCGPSVKISVIWT
jgi:hypothetical protein